MPITISKSKPAKAAALPKVETTLFQEADKLSDEELADAYGTLQDQISALEVNPLYAQFSLVETELKKRLKAEVPSEDTATIQGKHWVLEVGACSKTPRKLLEGAIPLIQKFLGLETFAKIAKVNISDCEKYLTVEQAEKVINSETSYTENRKIAAKFLG